MSGLRGPADPAAFRVTHYGARWYHDPLPSCAIAEATDDQWPSVTTLKKAWSKEFRKRWRDATYNLDALRVALFVDGEIAHLAEMNTDERVPLMAGAAKRDLRRAADRGTSVHRGIELLCKGREQEAAFECGDYLEAVGRLISELEPSIEFAEVVAVNRTAGFGGTVDAIATIGGKRYLVDWKSRGADSNHGAYESEAAQLGCYSLAEYLIGGDRDNARRVAMPDLDGLLVVSIKPDSYEVFPVDLDGAREGGQLMAETWAARRAGERAARSAIGKPVLLGGGGSSAAATVPAEEPAPNEERSTWVRDRLAVLADNEHAKAFVAEHWPAGVPAKGPWPDGQVDRIAEVLTEAEGRAVAPFHDGDPAAVGASETAAATADEPPGTAPPLRELDDGAPVSDLSELRSAVAGLEECQRLACIRWTREGTAQGRPWAIGGDGTTERTAAVAMAAAACARAFVCEADGISDDLIRAALHLAIGEEPQPSWHTGAIFGSLTLDEAGVVRDLADRFAASDTDVCARLGQMVAA